MVDNGSATLIDLSFHLSVTLIIVASHLPWGAVKKSQSRKVWKYSRANFELACALIDATDWDTILQGKGGGTGGASYSTPQYLLWGAFFAHYALPSAACKSFSPPPISYCFLRHCCRVTVLMRYGTNGPTTVLYPRGESSPWLTPLSDEPSPERTTIGKGQDKTPHTERNISNLVTKFYLCYVRGKGTFQTLHPSNPKHFWKTVKLLNGKTSTSIPVSRTMYS